MKTLRRMEEYLLLLLILLLTISLIKGTIRRRELMEAVEWKNIELVKTRDAYAEEYTRMVIGFPRKMWKKRVMQLQPRIDSSFAEIISEAVLHECKVQCLNPNLVLSIIFCESSFNPLRESSKEACGLMQINWKVHKDDLLKNLGITDKWMLFQIKWNVQAGCSILKKCLDKSNSIEDALRCYVGGEENDYISKVISLMANFEGGREGYGYLDTVTYSGE